MPSDESGGRTWRQREVELARRRKHAWLDNRGRLITWVIEPWPPLLWLSVTWPMLGLGILLGVLGTIAYF